ncbi:hypothetical protein [Deefgea piscis]|uniref:hypothetical protein n=1 Tax=Deefgea piscis TaxID=2739061 RepID=UPI001C8223D7|nr:hypothetical protein [Deefgea piscis]QZA80693.1 hypothetical protein K4H25_14505 [Deefgea piscis]
MTTKAFYPFDDTGVLLGDTFFAALSPVDWDKYQNSSMIAAAEAAFLLVGLPPPEHLKLNINSQYGLSDLSGLEAQGGWRKHNATTAAAKLAYQFMQVIQRQLDDGQPVPKIGALSDWITWADAFQLPIYTLVRELANMSAKSQATTKPQLDARSASASIVCKSEPTAPPCFSRCKNANIRMIVAAAWVIETYGRTASIFEILNLLNEWHEHTSAPQWVEREMGRLLSVDIENRCFYWDADKSEGKAKTQSTFNNIQDALDRWRKNRKEELVDAV